MSGRRMAVIGLDGMEIFGNTLFGKHSGHGWYSLNIKNRMKT